MTAEWHNSPAAAQRGQKRVRFNGPKCISLPSAGVKRLGGRLPDQNNDAKQVLGESDCWVRIKDQMRKWWSAYVKVAVVCRCAGHGLEVQFPPGPPVIKRGIKILYRNWTLWSCTPQFSAPYICGGLGFSYFLSLLQLLHMKEFFSYSVTLQQRYS